MNMKRQRGAAVIAIILLLGLLLITGFVVVWFVMPTGPGQEFQSGCQVNGLGQGTCSYTNTGWTPGTACSEVKIINLDGESQSSGMVCSGRVWPNDTVVKNISITIGDLCEDITSQGRSWSDICHMDIVKK